MHNLKLLHIRSLSCKFEHGVKFCPSATGNLFYVATEEGLHSVSNAVPDSNVELTPGPKTLVLWSDAGITTTGVVSCDVVDTDVCITTVEGDVLLYNAEDMEVEVAGSVCGGILCACWSPDQELLVLVTGEWQVMVLSAGQFVPVGEFSLQHQGFGEAPLVNLGWGKKETQFHGTEGKQAAQAGTAAAVSGLVANDDRKPRISWRGDGQMFVISYVDDQSSSRRLRIANRAGVLQYTSESVSELEHTLCWKPSGSLITSTQRLPNKYQVVFFEKNGLRHGEFSLPNKEKYAVKELMWNVDSTVLMVWFKPLDIVDELNDCHKDEDHVHYVQLWTVNNYKWYLKEEVAIENVQEVLWDTDEVLQLYVVTKDFITTYRWTFCINKSVGLTSEDLAIVSVINGNSLLMTPFRRCKIPPPTSAYEVIFPDQIHSVLHASQRHGGPSASNDNGTKSDTPSESCYTSNSVCVLHGSKITVLSSVATHEDLDNFQCKVDYKLNRSPHFKVTFPVHKIMAQFDLKEADEQILKDLRLYNCVWLNKNVIYAVNYCSKGSTETVISIDISGSNISIKSISTVYGPFLCTTCYSDEIYLQDCHGAVYILKHGDDELKPALDQDCVPIVFGSPCPVMEATSIGGDTFVFGLSARNRLYVGRRQLVGNCSSFHIHNDHLILTTTDHKLLMIPLDVKSILAVADGNITNVGERNVERGSKLITAVANDCEVLLQMPRGNLETIFPRPLLVHILQRLLDERKFYKAVELMRKHRVDMNLVYDHNPLAFISCCSEFVKSVDNAGWIDLFLACLKNEDTANILYSFNYRHSKIQTFNNDDISKVDRICIAVRESMIAADENKYFLPILTSHVKMDNCQMDEALKKVKELKDSKRSSLHISAEDGLRHLMYIADANVLCDVALGTYDFDLVMMVFEKSQKDPKEFLPFLNKLKKMELDYMKYNINVYLKRYKKAFHCINGTGAKHVDECMALVKKEKIFSIALDELIPSTPLFAAVAECYGDYNLGKGYYGEAALLYERAGKWEDALDAYKQFGNWRKVFITATKLKYSREDMHDLYISTIDVLKEKRMFTEAAIIYKDYLNNEEDTVDCLTQAHCWDDAVRIAHQHNRLDLIETNVLPELTTYSAALEKEIVEMSDTFTAHCARLAVVRDNMNRENLCQLEGQDESHLDPDMYCDSSTVTGGSHFSHSRGTRSHTGTNVSGRTYRSAKNRKKLERKKHSTKEGSSYEDLGLITELHSLIVKADNLAQPVGCLVATLYSFGRESSAGKLQTLLHDMFRLIESKEKVIWPSEDLEEDGIQPMVGGAHLSTAEIIRARQGGAPASQGVTLNLRLRELEPALRHAPKPSRPSNWALGFLQKKKLC